MNSSFYCLLLFLYTDSWEMVCLALDTMRLGCHEERSTTLHLIKRKHSITAVSIYIIIKFWGKYSLCSYLKSLVPSFNECADKFLEGLRPLADGKTTVPMKAHLAEVTLDVISKVGYELQ